MMAQPAEAGSGIENGARAVRIGCGTKPHWTTPPRRRQLRPQGSQRSTNSTDLPALRRCIEWDPLWLEIGSEARNLRRFGCALSVEVRSGCSIKEAVNCDISSLLR